MNKHKIINDPVHGFIKIPSDLIYDLIAHPYYQRLRRIKQLGLSEFIYPGAVHTRFHHALGAMHLIGLALETLKNKGVEITAQELEATQIAILLHDIGHGPMSHALEYSILKNVPHEEISSLFIQKLNDIFEGKLTLAKQIFVNEYPRKFFHQLVSSQLDMDRLDYLQRDRFFTGVMEGTVGAERIIKMLAVYQDEIVVEEKGILSIEQFLTARRLMYWQVYLHKTNICAEQMLIQTLRRAKHLYREGKKIPLIKSLIIFFEQEVNLKEFTENPIYLENFAQLDDNDIWACLKQWQFEKDIVLSTLSKNLLERKLFKIILSAEKDTNIDLNELKKNIAEKLKISERETNYFLREGIAYNEAYQAKAEVINILSKNGEINDIAQASDLPNIKALKKVVKKYYLCYFR
ncbi:MAG: HD domain-containing protein [Bacteroidetes bacterium]|nr:MAG: HD domain-containing protein [Bacteroidota bacterium]TAG90423.1 MAG: HD domain-containing protein [Bacteroidota bacterium]